eukprot:gnl/TRDRNA2_/TRDRNA2_183146_c0_seq1.p1 gnl/TRDRNA2_/TRDRNA2_183146_c0~~gnl/TRDRNA2_/TRDRNA2_183146_c0_seq1.p1  ORF type:complete len:426 (-),score=81.41 gnl/TRDRNA2_/TRDRNA2_183146_c0_seq1:89-1366(-)
MAHLILRSARSSHPLKCGGTTVIGRKDLCEVQVAHASVSGRHAELVPVEVNGEQPGEGASVALLRDLDSMNGTFADTEPHPATRVPPEGAHLALGDHVRFGFCPLIFRLEAAPAEDAAANGEHCLGTEAATEGRARRRSKQLHEAEASYLEWLAAVRDEYARTRAKAEEQGAAPWMAEYPDMSELQVHCPRSASRPLSRCATATLTRHRTSSGLLGVSPVASAAESTAAEALLARTLPGSDESSPDAGLAGDAAAAGENGVDPAEIEAEVARLAGRSWEVVSVIRSPITSESEMLQVEKTVSKALALVTDELPRAAAALGSKVKGPVFQALLARHGHTAPGHAARERIGTVCLEDGPLSAEQLDVLASAAETLCSLLRIKVEDDGDLGLARAVLEDTTSFFADLSRCASWRGMNTWELFAECNDV